jgi:hypothetical protein
MSFVSWIKARSAAFLVLHSLVLQGQSQKTIVGIKAHLLAWV